MKEVLLMESCKKKKKNNMGIITIKGNEGSLKEVSIYRAVSVDNEGIILRQIQTVLYSDDQEYHKLIINYNDPHKGE